MVFSASAFGAYFRLTQGGPSNSSHVDLLAPVSMEPTNASVELAWLAVGSMCLFTAGERGPMGGEVSGGRRGRPGFLQLPASPGLPGLTSHTGPHLCVYSTQHVPNSELSLSLLLSLNPRNSTLRRPRHYPVLWRKDLCVRHIGPG